MMTGTAPPDRGVGRRVIDGIALLCGAAFLVGGIIQFAAVALRASPLTAPVWFSELATGFHALALFFVIGTTLAASRHVRLSGFRRGAEPSRPVRWTTCILATGLAVTLLWTSLPYVAASWNVGEGSVELGGLSGLYWVKSGLLVLALGLLVGAWWTAWFQAQTGPSADPQ